MKLKKYSNGDPKIAKLGRGYHEYPVLTIPEGFLRTEVTDVKILDKKAQRTFLIFDSTDQFKAFQYILKWDNDEKNKGMRKSWVFHSRLYDILKNKYGEPTSDEISPTTKAKEIPSGTPYSTYWEDDDGSSVTLLITRQTHDAVIATIDAYLVFVVYKQEDYGVNTKWEVDSEDDL
ncbi:MAG TPA: hypothetical protein PLF13_10950 [candidate division Zixibacteria bacterium]|nr:hypothetical protein [candidate division Zixibacteria bacterium]